MQLAKTKTKHFNKANVKVNSVMLKVNRKYKRLSSKKLPKFTIAGNGIPRRFFQSVLHMSLSGTAIVVIRYFD